MSLLFSSTSISCFVIENNTSDSGTSDQSLNNGNYQTDSGFVNKTIDQSHKNDSVFEWSLSLVGKMTEALGGNASYVESVRIDSPW